MFHPFAGTGPADEAGVAMCTACGAFIGTTAGVAFVKATIEREPYGPVALADEATDEDPWAVPRALGVPDEASGWWGAQAAHRCAGKVGA